MSLRKSDAGSDPLHDGAGQGGFAENLHEPVCPTLAHDRHMLRGDRIDRSGKQTCVTVRGCDDVGQECIDDRIRAGAMGVLS